MASAGVAATDQVSILVAVDRPRQPGQPTQSTMLSPVFQSLLRWIGLVNDLASLRHGGYSVCFNPCCGGSASSTRPVLALQPLMLVFSILVAVDRPRQPHIVSGGPEPARVSILVAVDRPRQRPVPRARAMIVVSILVAVDRPRQPWSRLRRLGAEFQSLLRWIGVAGLTPGYAVAQPRPDRPVFQSLLRWIGPSPALAEDVRIDECMFQSLLRWIGLVNHRSPCREMGRTRGFNPCCGGSASSDRRRLPSIPASSPRCFNPCCGGSASSTAVAAARSRTDEGFNPCCGGSASSTAPDAFQLGCSRCFNPCCGGSASGQL